jgi:acetyl-CoA carboxylase biotin carboxyl carrier protein
VELKQIKELMAAMEKAGMKKMSIKETTGFELSLERECESHAHPAPSAPMYHPPHYSQPHRDDHAHRFPAHPHKPHDTAHHSEKKEEKEGKYVTSPMVGTFYSSPSPDDAPFVKVGDRVDENTVVCIIEAMKVMNEVKAGASGTIAEICVENGHPLEFGSKILRIV